jgi:hypothetical protein
METHVYANDEEVCSKSADGKSSCAFPDPCWSPPPPKPGPILVPYANTAYAKDLVNGTDTVFIHNQPAALKNVSYFSTSTGNEAATTAFKKGDRSGVVKGKAYFEDWSQNVKFEGLNVCRHTDPMTHNHS